MPLTLTPFVDPLPRPAVAQPTSGSPGGSAAYTLSIRQVQQRLHRDLPLTTVWGFGDGTTGATYPGPTIEAGRDQPVTVTWVNDLRDGGVLRTSHYLPVDTCMDGADDASPRTVSHLHGGHVPAAFDGYPEATILPGEQAIYQYPNAQLPATLWYHDHALGITRLNVYMGLAGFYLLRDAVEASLGLPAGEFEVPLAIQDRSFNADGSLQYPATWQDHFFGDTLLVNGKVWPYLEVKRGKYRFRLLNGSTSRAYTLALSSGASFQVIGREGGLLPAPVAVSTITLTPGERADVVLDFASHAAGTEVLLTNSAPAPYPGTPGEGVVPEVMKFVVLPQVGHTAALPATLRPLEVLAEADAVESRSFELRRVAEPCAGQAWRINGLGWQDLTEFPQLGATEIWSFVNRSGVSHPMHMHLVMFQVLDRQAFEIQNGLVVPIGPRVPPAPEETGWRDTAQVPPNEIVRVIARFEDYKGRFPYHCHILEHEDHEMMRQFQTVLCGDGELDPGEACDDGNIAAGDGCAPDCTLEGVITTTTTSTTTTLPAPLCGSAPLPAQSCRLVLEPLKASVQLKDNLDDSKDQVKWKWKKGAATLVADFKDPVTGSATMQFCVYDASSRPQPLLGAALLAGGMCGTSPCWKTTGTTGYAFKNKAGTPQGLTKVKFKSGITGKAVVTVQGKGLNLDMPALPLTAPATVQLLIDDGGTTECWQTSFSTAIKNDPTQFKAKGP